MSEVFSKLEPFSLAALVAGLASPAVEDQANHLSLQVAAQAALLGKPYSTFLKIFTRPIITHSSRPAQ